MNQFSFTDINKIASRIKSNCTGCPQNITRFDIKDEILNVRSPLHLYLMKRAHRESLFADIVLCDELTAILSSISTSIDPYTRRRIALFHGAIQAPMIYPSTDQEQIQNDFLNTEVNLNKHELIHIFLGASNDALSIEPHIPARQRIKDVSDLYEGAASDSLFETFKIIIEKKIIMPKVVFHNVQIGSRNNTSFDYGEMLTIIFDFDPHYLRHRDTPHYEEMASSAMKAKEQEMIINQLEALRNASYKETMLLLE